MTENLNTETVATETDGTLTPETVLGAYRAADGTKGRNAVRKAAETARDAAIDALDIDLAKSWAAAIRDLTVSKAAAPKVETDWLTVSAGVVADLRALADAIETAEVRIPGCPDEVDLSGLTESAASADRTTVTESVLAACKVAGTGPRTSVQSVFDAAFEGTEEGTVLTVAEICNKAGYPHQGAVAARLTGVCTLKGYVPVPATTDTALGAKRS